MRSLFEFLSKSKNLLLLACLFILFNFLLGSFIPKEYALDLKFAYTADEAYLALGSMNWEIRNIYRMGVWFLDMPYMVIYSLFFTGILFRLWRSRKVAWLTLSILLMDLMENILVLRLLKTFPGRNESLAMYCSLFSTIKWTLVVVMVMMIFIGLVNYLRHIPAPESQKAKI
jgi:hypothetical protein